MSMFVVWLVLLAVISASLAQQDIRVSKGLGKRGYESVRVSVISAINSTQPSSSIFSYQQPFQYRWKQFYLSSGKNILTNLVNCFNRSLALRLYQVLHQLKKVRMRY